MAAAASRYVAHRSTVEENTLTTFELLSEAVRIAGWVSAGWHEISRLLADSCAASQLGGG